MIVVMVVVGKHASKVFDTLWLMLNVASNGALWLVPHKFDQVTVIRLSLRVILILGRVFSWDRSDG